MGIAIITAAGTIVVALISMIGNMRSLRRENTAQHAQGRELLIEHGLKLDAVQADVKEIQTDVKAVTRRVDHLEDREPTA